METSKQLSYYLSPQSPKGKGGDAYLVEGMPQSPKLDGGDADLEVEDVPTPRSPKSKGGDA